MSTGGGNMLYELAQTMAASDGRSAAAALRKLAQAGYTSLDQVHSASDWILLSIPGIGVGRLAAVRQLTRPEWQLPSPQAIKAASRFLSAIQFALRFWSPEALAALIQETTPPPVHDRPHESRLAAELVSKAARKALAHCQGEELVQLLWQTKNGHDALPSVSSSGYSVQVEMKGTGNREEVASNIPERRPCTVRETDHFAFPRQERQEVVRHFRAARERGEVQNKDRWAQTNYNISGRTLLNYEREFPETGRDS